MNQKFEIPLLLAIAVAAVVWLAGAPIEVIIGTPIIIIFAYALVVIIMDDEETDENS